MTDYQFPQAPQIERAYRAAHRALEGIVSPSFSFVPEEDLPITDVISQFGSMVQEAELQTRLSLGRSVDAAIESGEWIGPHGRDTRHRLSDCQVI
ncbi:hypothetical protein OG417_05085 [Actinoallomurus sp. NBC_01490]|uniref:hypothetical protein n=1 Tax=Actinoallomurus sp. NBC_01490 TaxID=2903557 RepID=UPI002E3808F0|nr:hypothetical protein [Actinoallomurus sp. NBC_01490]